MTTVAEVLQRGQDLGIIGGRELEVHLAHAQRFVAAWGDDPAPSHIADLGSGAGLPGLVLAEHWPDAHVLLIEVRKLRAEFLVDGVAALEWDPERVEVAPDRAEVVAQASERRESFDLVTARSFGPPALVAECAAPLLRIGGRLLVSEPPESTLADRWPEEPLRPLGLRATSIADGPGRIAIITKNAPCEDRFPRQTAVLKKRPLYTVD